MAKLGTTRKTKTSEKATARRRRSSPAPTFSPESVSPVSTFSHEEIARRAYAFFLGRGGQHGDDWGDWFRAEAELLRERSESSSPGK